MERWILPSQILIWETALFDPNLTNPPLQLHGCRQHSLARVDVGDQRRTCVVFTLTPVVVGKQGLSPQDSVSAALQIIKKNVKSNIWNTLVWGPQGNKTSMTFLHKKKKKKVVSLKVACCITLADAEEVKEGVLKDLHWLLIGGNCSSGVSCPFTAFPSLTKANAVGSAEVHRYRHVSSFCDRNTQSNSSSFTLIFKTATNVRQQLFILWNYISVPSLS